MKKIICFFLVSLLSLQMFSVLAASETVLKSENIKKEKITKIEKLEKNAKY